MSDVLNTEKQSVFNKARKDKFLLVLSLPSILKKLDSKILSERAKTLVQLETLQFSVYGSPVPGVSIPAHNQPIFGQPYHVTSQTREPYPPITVNFTVDNRFNNYWVLWKWLEVLNHPIDSGMDSHFATYEPGENSIPLNPAGEKSYLIQKGTNTKSNITTQPIKMKNNFLDYQTIITIIGLDEYNQKTIEFEYTNAFITNLAEITYNYRDPGEMESSFQFAFNQLHINLVGPTY